MKFIAQRKKPKGWDLIVELQNTSPFLMPYHHVTEGLFIEAPFTQHSNSATKKKQQGISEDRNTIWRDKASIRPRHNRDVRIIRPGI